MALTWTILQSYMKEKFSLDKLSVTTIIDTAPIPRDIKRIRDVINAKK